MARYGLESKEVRLPHGVYISKSENRVYIKRWNDEGQEKRITIGKVATEDTFYPNKNFRKFFPKLWAENFPDS